MIKNILLILFVFILQLSCSVESAKLRIAVAANAQYAIHDIVKEFEKTYNIETEIIISSSGNLTAQIKNGAPYNLFLSADMKYPMDIYNDGFSENKPSVYAYGKLILWSLKNNISPSLDLLESKEIKHIAMANPKTAPYGKAAEETLTYYGILKKVKDKLVYGESVSQANQFIISKASEVGFTSYSSLFSNSRDLKGKYYLIDQRAYQPIKQGVVILKANSAMIDRANKFYNFLFSKTAKNIFSKYGYAVNYE